MSHIEELTRRLSIDGLRVVDIGAGTGAFAGQLAEHNAQVIGIEIDAEKVELARRALGGRARFETGRAEALPIDGASTDLVTVLYAWHHIPTELHAAAAEEIARVLKTGGTLFVAEPKTSGGMTEIVLPVDDETEVRERAADFLEQLGTGRFFRPIEKSDYVLTRRYKDFDTLVKSVVFVDPVRATLFAQRNADVRDRFERHARPDGDGFLIDQPTTLYVFEKI